MESFGLKFDCSSADSADREHALVRRASAAHRSSPLKSLRRNDEIRFYNSTAAAIVVRSWLNPAGLVIDSRLVHESKRAEHTHTHTHSHRQSRKVQFGEPSEPN